MAIDPQFVRQLAAVGACAPSADNAQPYQIRWDGATLDVAYAERHAKYNVFGQASHATLLSVGAVVENLSAALAANGLPADWHFGTTDGEPYARVAIDHAPTQFQAPSGPLLRHTNRHPYRSDPMPAGVAAGLAGLCEGGNRLTLLSQQESRAQLVPLIRRCSEARFCNPLLHAWLFGSLRYTPEQIAQGDGLDIHTLGLPPGGRQMMGFIADWKRMAMLNRFGAYKLLALSEVGLVAAAPGLLCLSGPATRQGALDAGRLLARAWTQLNEQGIAVHPYYVVTDQLNRLQDGTLAPGFAPAMADVAHKLQALLGLQAGEMLHMILRVGLPKTDPVRARRLPPEATFTIV